MTSEASRILIVTCAFFSAFVLTVLIILPLGTGNNQQITEEVIIARLRTGMSIEEVGANLALDFLDSVQSDRNTVTKVVSTTGYCSRLWPQKSVTLLFSNEKLVSARVETIFNGRSAKTEIILRP